MYTPLFLLTPLLNKGIESTGKLTYLNVIILLFILLTVFPNHNEKDIFFTNKGYSLIWLIILYVIGGFLRRIKISKKLRGTGYTFLWLYLYLLLTILK